jgi:poly-gamma-glutamate capsule biosynthesis protein CapA/YwtB (metallophosphatase superfamily)
MAAIVLLGDVMLGRGVCDELRVKRAEDFWGTTLPVLRAADAVICNLECAVTRCVQRWTKTPKVFHFRTDVAAIEVLRAANIKCVTLANNHTLDFGVEGLLETLRYLDLADIDFAGAGHNEAEAQEPALFEVGVGEGELRVKVAVVSLTDNEPDFAAGPEHPGTNYLPIGTDAATMARIESWIDRARGIGAEFIILSPHWGPNMVQIPPQRHINFAHEAINRGADVVFGHSAHLFQAVELYKDKFIVYDGGDFLDDYAVDPRLRNDQSFMFTLEIDETSRQATRLRLIPVKLTYAQVDVAQGKDFHDICARMAELCRQFKTPLSSTPEGFEIALGRTAASTVGF